MDISFLKRGLEAGYYPSLQPIILTGEVGSGKHAAGLDLASTFASEKNIFTIEMDAKIASMETLVDEEENLKRIICGTKDMEFSLPPLTQAIQKANEGEPAVVIFDLKGEDKSNIQFEIDLLHFITSGELSYGVDSTYVLNKESEANLLMLIVKQNGLQLSDPLVSRCLTVRDFDKENNQVVSR